MKNQIKVYDGLIPFSEIDRMFTYVSNSLFRIGWSDVRDLRANNHSYLHSVYNDQDLNNLGLLQLLNGTEIEKELEGYEINKCVVNLSVPSNVHYHHSHPEDIVLLYYANVSWEPHYAGETMFFTHDAENIRQAVKFKPGRIVLFDAKIPHAIRPQSSAGPDYRFTVAVVFKKKETV